MVWDYSINTHNASLLWQARNNTLRQLLFATVQYSKTVRSCKAMLEGHKIIVSECYDMMEKP